MIGDWVLYNTTPKRIGGIDGKIIRFFRWDVWENPSAIEPIPLTAEILNKNFPKSCENDYWVDGDFPIIGYSIPCHTDGYCPYVEVSIYDPARVMEFELYLNYVHELQHALRLCGIKKDIEL